MCARKTAVLPLDCSDGVQLWSDRMRDAAFSVGGRFLVRSGEREEVHVAVHSRDGRAAA